MHSAILLSFTLFDNFQYSPVFTRNLIPSTTSICLLYNNYSFYMFTAIKPARTFRIINNSCKMDIFFPLILRGFLLLTFTTKYDIKCFEIDILCLDKTVIFCS